jgi:hypothetical protein
METKDDNQNVRWDYAKRKNQISFSIIKNDLILFYFFNFAYFLLWGLPRLWDTKGYSGNYIKPI